MKFKTITLLTFIGLLVFMIFRIYSFYEVYNLYEHRGEEVPIDYLVSRPLILLGNIFLILFFYKLYKNQETETSIKSIFRIQEKTLQDKVLKEEKQKTKSMKKVIFTIIGAILGLPLSYYFQPDMVQAKIGGINGYVQHFDEILEAKDLIGNVVMGVVVFAIIGFIIGYFMDKNANTKTD